MDEMTFPDELRALADWLEQHPSMVPRYPTIELNHFYSSAEDLAAARREAGGTWKKAPVGDWFALRHHVTPNTCVDLNISRERACERVLVGTRTVEVPDPALVAEVPLVSVEEPQYEWSCTPLLEPARAETDGA